MAKFFFFTEPEKLLTQTLPDKAFGSIGDDGGDFDCFNITSLHSIAPEFTDIKAISCCSGDIIVVADAIDTDRVNLLIRPSEQSSIGLPGIKYIIYRGILRSSLISGANIASRDSNDLTESIWFSQEKRNKSYDKSVGNPDGTTTTQPELSSLEIIINIDHPEDTLIASLFVDPLNGEAQHPLIEKGGLHIGDFATTDFGIEFIVDEIGFEPDLKYLTINQYIIQVPKLTVTSTQVEIFDHWNDKEKMLFFLDPCAVFGSFNEKGLSIWGTSPKKDDELYTDVIVKFMNKNYVYIDIRNELNYSYDYFKNYTGIYINFLDPNLDVDLFNFPFYNLFELNWPILRIHNLNFLLTPNEYISEQLELQIAFPKRNNPNPTFVLKQGNIKKPEIYRKKRLTGNYRHIIFPNNSETSEKVSLLIPNYMPSSGEVNLISSYVRISYVKQSQQCINTASTLSIKEFRSWYDLDNIFTPFEMFLPWGDTPPNPALQIQDSWVYKNECYTDVMRSSSQLFFANSGIARDSSGNITLFAFATNKLRGNRTMRETPFSLVGRRENVGDSSFISRIARQFTLSSVQIIDQGSGQPVEFFGNVVTSVIENFKEYNPDDFAFLTFSQADWTTLQSVAASSSFLPGYKIHLGFRFISSTIAPAIYNDGFTSNGIDLINFEVVLRGFRLDATATEIESFEVPTGINHFRIRKNITNDVMTRNTRRNIDAAGNPIPNDDNLTIPRISKKGYTITNLGNNLTMPEPLGKRMNPSDDDLQSHDVSSRAISCNLYLFRADDVTPETFCSVMTYIRENIQLVWNSETNYGLGTTYDPFLPPDPSPTPLHPSSIRKDGEIFRSYWIDASDVHVLEASNRHFDLLEENEVLWLVANPGASSGRSFVDPENRRTGVFYSNTIIPQDTDPIPAYIDNYNTAGHEFGHVLGLSDRYRTWANVLNNKGVKNNDPADESTNAAMMFDSPVSRGDKMITYLTMNQDDEYPIRYNWLHNLMSSQKEVSWDGNSPIQNNTSVKNETTYYCHHYPYRTEGGKITLFVTRQQLHYVVNHLKEPKSIDYCFFKSVSSDDKLDSENGENVFVGTHEHDGEDRAVSDLGYQKRWWQYSLYDHQMVARLRNSADESDNTDAIDIPYPDPDEISIEWGRLEGFFTPFDGIQKLSSSNEPIYQFSFPATTRRGGNITITELETGGNSYNRRTLPNRNPIPDNYGINQYHLFFASIIELTNEIDRLYRKPPPGGYNAQSSLLSTSNAAQCPYLNILRNQWPLILTNDLGVLQQLARGIEGHFNPQFINDAYSNMGKGDEKGRSYWNMFVGENNRESYKWGLNGVKTLNPAEPNGSIIRDFLKFQSVYGDITLPPSPDFVSHLAYYEYINRKNSPSGQELHPNFIALSNQINPDIFTTFSIRYKFFYNRRRIIALINNGS